MTTDEKLSAFISGDLSPPEIEEIRRMVESDKSVADRLAALEAVDSVLSSAYRPFVNEPISIKVMDLLHGADSTTPKIQNTVFGIAQFINRLQQWALPLAVCSALVIGIGVGALIFAGGQPNAPMVALLNGPIDEGNSLYETLESGPSAKTIYLDEANSTSITPVLTFRSRSGGFCREFILVDHRRRYRSAACRNDDHWDVQIITASGIESDPSNFKVAADAGDVAFDQAIRTVIDGSPFTAAEENEILTKNWRNEKSVGR